MFEYVIHVFNAGGLVMYPLAAFLLASWTIGIDRIRAYRSFKGEIAFLEGITREARDEQLDKNQFLSLVHQKSQEEGANKELLKLLCPVFSRAGSGSGLEHRLEDLVAYTDGHLKRGLHWLSMIVTMAPLLGLLGTVLGMIRSFNAVGAAAGAAPTVITGGVGEALVATASGLLVAIVALSFHSYCANEVNKFISRLEYECGTILDVFSGSK